jgi:FtsP/CotA-like multicopper oxidase with cupredoxin domain
MFHIHVNRFKITRINGATLPTRSGGIRSCSRRLPGDSITFESNFVDFTGRHVEHCQLLSHEDPGMMSSIEVIP